MQLWPSFFALILSVKPSSAGINSRATSHNSLQLPINNTKSTDKVRSSSNSSLSIPRVQCNGQVFGRNLMVQKCLDALNQIIRDPNDATFGHRNSGDFDVPLPGRTVSGDGSCAFTITIPQGLTDVSTMMDVYDAGLRLLYECRGSAGRANGGVIAGIGRHGSLEIQMASYKPTIRCQTTRGPAPQSCLSVYNRMLVSSQHEVFTHDESPFRFEVIVPWAVPPEFAFCGYTVDVAGEKDSETRYHLWEAMVALDDMCVRFGKIGTAYALGQDKKVIVEVGRGRRASIAPS